MPLTHDLFHPFTSEQFHALLNSLFKVLFNFPSRYLFAIGLAGIFSLGWNIPPILSCTHKQLDSRETPTVTLYLHTGLSPSSGNGRVPTDLRDTNVAEIMMLPHTTFLTAQRRKVRCWADPCSLAVTKGILFSFFSSAK